MRSRLAIAGLVMFIVALVVPEFAAAAGSSAGTDIGKNLGDMLSGWGKSLFFGVSGIVAATLLLGRKVQELAVFCFCAIVVGGFVLSHAVVADAVQGIWKALAG